MKSNDRGKSHDLLRFFSTAFDALNLMADGVNPTFKPKCIQAGVRIRFYPVQTIGSIHPTKLNPPLNRLRILLWIGRVLHIHRKSGDCVVDGLGKGDIMT